MYKKEIFLEEMDALRRSRRGHNPSLPNLWSIEYDLIAIGYDNVSEEAKMLCETPEQLQEPTDNLSDLIQRYEILKEKSMSKVKREEITQASSSKDVLCRTFLNLNNHLTVIEFKGERLELPAYKNTPRVEYSSVEHPKFPEFGQIILASNVKNLPLPMKGLNLVVSRETLRAVNEIEHRVLNKEWKGSSIQDWLDENDLKIRPKIRYISMENIEEKWPALKDWFDTHVPKNQQRDFLRTLKRYVGRNDLWSPGPRIWDKDGNVVACRGLVQIVT